MAAISDYTNLRTWYQRDQFSEFGAYKILGLIVVPVLREVLDSLGDQDQSLEYDFVLYRDRRGSPSEGRQYLVVLAFDLDGDFAFKCRVSSPSSVFPTVVSFSAGNVRHFSDVDAVRILYESWE